LAKSYLAAHPSWFNEDSDMTGPRCGTEPETFQHAIITCSARTRVRNLLLKDVSFLGHDGTLWTETHLLRALGEYITHTKTGFPPNMTHEYFPTPPPRTYPRLNQFFREGDIFLWLLVVLHSLYVFFLAKNA